MIKNLIMTVGLPGCGKSSFYKKHYPSYHLISEDKYLENISVEEGITYCEAFDLYADVTYKAMFSDLNTALAKGENIYWDQPNLTIRSRREKLKIVAGHGYKVICVVWDFSRDFINWRLSERQKQTGKNIPKEVIDSMFTAFQMPTALEGFTEIRNESDDVKELVIINTI